MNGTLLGRLLSDPVVFGDWQASPWQGVPANLWRWRCGACQVEWTGQYGYSPCWCCGRMTLEDA